MIDLITRYESLITVINFEKSKMLALKFKKIDNKLFAFNFYERKENQKLIEVTKINGVLVSSFIKEFDIDDFYDIEKMKTIGIDTTKEFKLELKADEKNIVYNILDENSKDDIFRKDQEINENIKLENPIEYKQSASENAMLNYASTNTKALMTILKNLSVSDNDKDLMNDFLITISQFNEYFINLDNNLDVLFLSTQMFCLNDMIDYIPSKIKDILNRVLIIDYDSKPIIPNDVILTDGIIDYKKVVSTIRNCLAHSNYKVSNEGLVEFLYESKNKIKISMYTKDLKHLFKSIIDFYLLEGVFPVIHYNIPNSPSPFSREELIDFLKNMEIFTVRNMKIKQFNNSEKQDYMDASIGLDVDYFYLSISDCSKKQKLESFESRIKKHLSDDSELIITKLSEEEIKTILNIIEKMGSNYFFSLGKTTQIQIIKTIIRKKYNKQYEIIANIDEIINSKYDSNETLINQASNYIKLNTKIELVITAIFNNIFLFCFNQNKEKVDVSGIKFPRKIYQDYLRAKVKEFYDISKSSSDYNCLYKSLLQVASSHSVPLSVFRETENGIIKEKNKLIKSKNSIEIINRVLDEKATEDEFRKVNLEIINRFRNSLAHGKLKVECNDFQNISGTTLIVEDFYEGQRTFYTETTFGDMFSTINQQNFLQSLLNDNQNFLKHNK